MILFMIIGGIVSSRLKSKFKKYSKIPTTSGLSGRDIALKMLEYHQIDNVKIISVAGKLTDQLCNMPVDNLDIWYTIPVEYTTHVF